MQDRTFGEYMELDQELASCPGPKRRGKDVRIAILGSFALNGFKEILNVKCRDAGIRASFYIGGYGQYANDMLDPKSLYYRFRAEITFLVLDTESVLGEAYFNPYGLSEKKRSELIRYSFNKIKALADKFAGHGSGILVVNNFAVPSYSPMGILEPKVKGGYFEMVRRLNALISAVNRHRSVFIFDYESFLSEIGKRNVTDHKLRYLADMKISPDAMPILCEEYMRYIRALKGLSRKCIVLDLDNTLWGGVIGEDGMDGIALGPTAPGNAYLEFQRHLLALFNRGVILAVNSNNNPEDAIEVFEKHPHMALKTGHFAAMKINWESKVKNIVDIAGDINIGLDSIIYFDDDRANRQMVREALPQVLCPELPEDGSGHTAAVRQIKDIDVLQVTSEDAKRGRLYAAERSRKEARGSFRDLSGYLEHLGISAEIRIAQEKDISRISQLTMRTNQFNFSTRRYSESDIGKIMKDENNLVCCVKVTDRYGDYGMSGALIIRKNGRSWRVDTFLLSCRVLGRNVENALIAWLAGKAADAGARELVIDYSRTHKNYPVERFLKGCGFPVPRAGGHNKTVAIFKKGSRCAVIKPVRHVKVVER
jgi:FkbH-like protein